MKLTREVKTGILAVCAIALLIFGYSFLKGKNLLENDRTFYAVYDNVEGLIPSSPVTINGLTIGKVTNINFADKEGNLVVAFIISNNFQFSDKSIAQVYGGGLIGGKSLAIIPKYGEGRPAKDGDTLPGRIEAGLLELVNEKLTPLQEKLESAITDADTLLTSVNTVLSPRNQENVNAILNDLRVTARSFRVASGAMSSVLGKNQEKLDQTVSNLSEMSANLKDFSSGLSAVDLKKLDNNLSSVLTNLNNTLANLDKGTIGKLSKDEELYTNLTQSTKQLELLLQDFRLNPKRYVNVSVFGRKPAPYEVPENDPYYESIENDPNKQ